MSPSASSGDGETTKMAVKLAAGPQLLFLTTSPEVGTFTKAGLLGLPGPASGLRSSRPGLCPRWSRWPGCCPPAGAPGPASVHFLLFCQHACVRAPIRPARPPSTHLHIRLSIPPSCPLICLSTHYSSTLPSFCPFVCVFIQPCNCVSVHPSTCPSLIHPPPSLHLSSICPSVHPCVHLPMCPSF